MEKQQDVRSHRYFPFAFCMDVTCSIHGTASFFFRDRDAYPSILRTLRRKVERGKLNSNNAHQDQIRSNRPSFKPSNLQHLRLIPYPRICHPPKNHSALALWRSCYERSGTLPIFSKPCMRSRNSGQRA